MYAGRAMRMPFSPKKRASADIPKGYGIRKNIIAAKMAKVEHNCKAQRAADILAWAEGPG